MPKKVRTSLLIAILFILLWLILMIVLLQIPIARPEGEWSTIINSEYSFSLDYPRKWNARTYGEEGFKGSHETRLRIYRSLRDVFEITVYQRTATNPTLDNVVAWGFARIYKISIRGGNVGYEEFDLYEDTINGQRIRRRIYGSGTVKREDVYIVRPNDMIIITLQSTKNDFDNYNEDFDQILNSFKTISE